MRNIIAYIAAAFFAFIVMFGFAAIAKNEALVTQTALRPKVIRHDYFQDTQSMDNYVGKCIRDGFRIVSVASMTAYDNTGW